MIVLDTNVVSELMRPEPDRRVVEWVAGRAAAQLYTTALTTAEVRLGIELLPKGRRRDAIQAAAEAIFEDDFGARVLPFDSAAAREYAAIVATRRRAGRPIDAIDAQIGAICRAYGTTLATRNVEDFDGCGVDVVDPWRARKSAGVAKTRGPH